jgi:hypothetical protein
MPASVILSEAKNLIDSRTYTLEILRLTPQNDVVGRPRQTDCQNSMKNTTALAVLTSEGTGIRGPRRNTALLISAATSKMCVSMGRWLFSTFNYANLPCKHCAAIPK